MQNLVLLIAVASSFSAGCSKFGDFEPTYPTEDPRLGTKVIDTDETRPTFVSSYFYEGRLLVSAYLGGGYDGVTLQSDPTERIVVYQVDPDTLEVTELPAPPFTPGRTQYFTRVLSGDGVLMVAGEDEDQLAYFDGSSWSPREVPPGHVSTHGRISAWGADRLYHDNYFGEGTQIHDGGGWRDFGPTRADAALSYPVAFSETEVAFVTLDAGQICARRYETPSGDAIGEPSCWETPVTVRELQANFNGTVAAHRVLVGHDGAAPGAMQLLTIRDGVFEEGPTLPQKGTLYSSPGQDRLLVRDRLGEAAPGTVDAYLTVDDAASQPAFGPFALRTQCDCDRNLDAACDCVARGPIVSLVRFAPDLSQAAVLWLDQLDGRRRTYLRLFDLPYTDDPYAVEVPIAVDAGPPRCDLRCDPWETCLFNSNGGQVCWPRDMVPDGGIVVLPTPDGGADSGPPDAGSELGATILPDVQLTDGTLATMEVVGLGERPAPFALRGDGTQSFDVQPFATYALTFSGPGHHDASFEVTAGAFGSSRNAGPHVLARGTLLGPAPASPRSAGPLGLPLLGTVVHPDGDLLVTSDADGRWLLVRGGGSGAATVTAVAGFTARNMADLEWQSATFTPDGALALLDTTDGLIAVDVATGAVRGSAISGGPFDMSTIAFAGAASTFVIRSSFTDSVRRIGPAVVVSWTATALTEVLRLSEPGKNEHLRADGAELVRAEPDGAAVVVAVPAGTRTPTGSVGMHGFGMISPSGRYIALVSRQRTDAMTRPLCWDDFEACRIRVYDRVMPAVSTLSTAGGRFWMSTTSDRLAFEDGAAVHVVDLTTGGDTTVPVDGLVRGRGLGFQDTFTVNGNAGLEVIRLSTATNVLHAAASGRAFQRLLYQRPDGTILVAPAPGCLAACEAFRVDPTALSVETLAGLGGRGNLVGGRYEMATPLDPIRLRSISTMDLVDVTRGGGGTADYVYTTALAHDAPCVVLTRVQTWDPAMASMLYCAP